MKRTHVVFLMTVAAVALLLIAIAAMTDHRLSQAAPLVQVTAESSQNDSCNTADHIGPGIPVQAAISPVTDTDFFSVTIPTSKIGNPYIARASIGPADFSIRICVRRGDCFTEMYCSPPSSSSTSVSWNAVDTVHYVKVERWGSALITQTTTVYVLEVVEEYVPPPTSTATPSRTPTPSPLPTASVDAYEPNNSFSNPYPIPIATSITLSDLAGVASFNPANDEDWYKVWAKNGKWYEVETKSLSGVDTYLEIRDTNNQFVKSDDDGAGGYASKTTWRAAYDGFYYIRVVNKVGTTGTYNMTIEETDGPTPGPTSTPGPGPDSSIDDCEDNSTFERACIIPLNKPLPFNLVPPFAGTDNDFYKVWVKPGFIYECRTSNLAPGIDPNMIVFNGPSWNNAVGGNDDVEPGNFNSYFSYYATYEGWMYVLIGTGNRTPSDIYNSSYTLECNLRQSSDVSGTGTPTPTRTPGSNGAPTATPYRATATPTVAPTSAPPENLTIRLLSTPAPVPVTTPAPRFVPVRLLVYYDGNNDGQLGAGEGIAGISAQAYEAATNQLLAQGFTDEQGGLEFTVAVQGPVRVRVPFFGFSQLIAGEETTIYLRIPPQALPKETP